VIEGCASLGVRTKEGAFLAIPIASSNRKFVWFNGDDIQNGQLNRTAEADATKDGGDDIAIIRTQVHTSHFAKFRHEVLHPGEKVIMPEYTSTPGIFSRRSGELITNGYYITFSGPGRKGNSGSPVYDASGYLVGIQHSTLFTSFNPFNKGYNMGTHSYYIAKFLQYKGIGFSMAADGSPNIADTEDFDNSFAVGILCSD